MRAPRCRLRFMEASTHRVLAARGLVGLLEPSSFIRSRTDAAFPATYASSAQEPAGARSACVCECENEGKHELRVRAPDSGREGLGGWHLASSYRTEMEAHADRPQDMGGAVRRDRGRLCFVVQRVSPRHCTAATSFLRRASCPPPSCLHCRSISPPFRTRLDVYETNTQAARVRPAAFSLSALATYTPTPPPPASASVAAAAPRPPPLSRSAPSISIRTHSWVHSLVWCVHWRPWREPNLSLPK